MLFNYKPKILIFESLPHVAGGQRVLLNIIPFLKINFDVTVTIPDKGLLENKLKEIGINTIKLNPGSYSVGKKNVWQIIKYVINLPIFCWHVFVLSKKFDLLYVNSVRVLPFVFIGSFFVKKPIIYHNHSLISDKKSLWLIEMISKSKKIKKIINVSEAVTSKNPLLKNKNIVIYNGIDHNLFFPTKNKAYNPILKLAVIGDLMPSKGQQFLIESLFLFKKTNWQLDIIGDTRPGQELYKNKIESLVYKLNLNQKVNFLGRRENIPDLIKDYDLILVPSQSFEALGLVTLEAAACAIPVIASDLGGTKEIIANKVAGFLYQNKNKESLIESLDNFFSMTNEERKKMGLTAYNIFLDKYKLTKSAEKIINAINAVLYETSANK